MKVPDKSNLAEYVRVEMTKLGISNSDLANSLGKTTATIVALRNGSASYKLYDKAITTIDNWRRLEQTK
jgi:ribosome-binding protein aMBF1 (putative translation factor)